MKKTLLFLVLSIFACSVGERSLVAMQTEFKEKLKKAKKIYDDKKKAYEEIVSQKANLHTIYEKAKQAEKERIIARKDLFFLIDQMKILKKYDELFGAIMTNDLEIIRDIITDENININARSQCEGLNGMTPLHYAVILDQITAVQILLDNGAKLNVEDDAGKISIEYADLYGHKKILSILLKHARLSGEKFLKVI